MSAADLIERAAGGELPDWSVAGPKRRAHMARVSDLLGGWAERLGQPPREVLRWRAVGWLHDALRDADPADLRAQVAPEFADFPAPLLHGPAAARRLESEGLDDPGLLRAVTYHTIGHPDLDRLGRMLYLADFLEPGRTYEPVLRAVLRARLPADADEVLRTVLAQRITYLLDQGRAVRAETMAFWNRMTEA